MQVRADEEREGGKEGGGSLSFSTVGDPDSVELKAYQVGILNPLLDQLAKIEQVFVARVACDVCVVEGRAGRDATKRILNLRRTNSKIVRLNY